MLIFYQWLAEKSLMLTKQFIPQWFSAEETLQGCHALAVDCALLCLAWPLGCAVGRRISRSFKALPLHKQWYVVANISKAACLAIISMHPTFFYDMIHVFYNNKFLDNDGESRAAWIKRISALYISSDIMALVLVPRLPQTTIAHHWIATLLCLALFATELQQANVTLMIALYGAWSSLTWPVNLFLALRCVFDGRWWLTYVAWTALCMYVVACFLNWGWHTVWFVQQVYHKQILFEWYGFCVLSYALAVCVVSRDDVILMRWLFNYTQKDFESNKQSKTDAVQECVQLLCKAKACQECSLSEQSEHYVQHNE